MFGHWSLDFVCFLIIGIWDFRGVSLKANRYYLHQLALTLTDPYHWVPHH